MIIPLGKRKPEDQKESSDDRHGFYMDEIASLRSEYGVRQMEFGDGDLMPGLVAASGILLDEEGSFVVKLGRSGLVEGETMDLGASQIKGAQMASRKVSNKVTARSTNPTTMQQPVEEGLLERLIRDYGYPANSFTTQRTKTNMEGKSVVAMTAVTGADPKRYGQSFADQMQRITFDPANKTVTAYTFLITGKGVFAVRTLLKAKDLGNLATSILAAGPEAQAYSKKDELTAAQVARLTADAAMTAEEVDRLITDAEEYYTSQGQNHIF